ncbi:thioester domain-containing protein [Ruminococcus sp. JE7B6]|uniref:thioester domain-containing protein n=1 Tax=Ruminococcus sp. JE7B6 TaxID=3233380 RepID=UPI0038999F3E
MKQVKRIIAVLLALTVIMLAACSDFGTAVKAAEIGGGNDVNLDCYGEYISNDELGELISYGGYISKSEYARHINDDSVGASYTPSFEGCYDTGGNQIYVRRAMARQYVGEAALMIFINSSRAYCIQPGEALNAYSDLTPSTSTGVWASLSGNQQQAINTALCFGREGNFSNIKGNTSINSDQCYLATQLIIGGCLSLRYRFGSAVSPALSQMVNQIREIHLDHCHVVDIHLAVAVRVGGFFLHGS